MPAGRASAVEALLNRPGGNPSFNRISRAGNDEDPSFLTSPEIVTALAFAGTLELPPVHGTMTGPDGKAFRFTPPEGRSLPAQGFAKGEEGYEAPAADGERVAVDILPNSDRLQLLQPFPRWMGRTSSSCPSWSRPRASRPPTTSPAGWLWVRGHLDKISDNMFLGALNAFTGEAGKGVNPITGAERGATFTSIARDLKARGLGGRR